MIFRFGFESKSRDLTLLVKLTVTLVKMGSSLVHQRQTNNVSFNAEGVLLFRGVLTYLPPAFSLDANERPFVLHMLRGAWSLLYLLFRALRFLFGDAFVIFFVVKLNNWFSGMVQSLY